MNDAGPCVKPLRDGTVPPRYVVGKLVYDVLVTSLRLIGYIVCSSFAARTTCEELIATKTCNKVHSIFS